MGGLADWTPWHVAAILVAWTTFLPLALGPLVGGGEVFSENVSIWTAIRITLLRNVVFIAAIALVMRRDRPALLGDAARPLWKFAAGLLGGLAIVVLVEFYAFGFDTLTGEDLASQVDPKVGALLAGGSRVRWIVGILTIVVSAPLAEEWIFRGLLQRGFRARIGPGPAILLASLLFAVVHYQPDLPPVFLAGQLGGLAIIGVILGFLVERTGSLLPAVVAHAVNNAVVMVVMAGRGLG